MQTFLDAIVSRISVPYKRLSIIKNPDGFLKDRGVQQAIEKEHGICFVSGCSLVLRCHFELTFKTDNSTRYCYITDELESILPDIAEVAYVGKFNISDLFPNYLDKQILKGQTYETIKYLYKNNVTGYVSAIDVKMLIMEHHLNARKQIQVTGQDFINRLKSVNIDWNDADRTIVDISTIVRDAIKAGFYAEIEPLLCEIEIGFQTGLIGRYSAAILSNPLLKAKAVNKVLPHIANNYKKSDKVSLVVVDGMTYWQYLELREHFTKAGIATEDNAIYSWMPSITMLSRQAIFRGDNPRQDYKQCPANESKLWLEYWVGKGINHSDIQYIYDGDNFEIYDTTKRLALVTVELDEKMHASSDNRDLMALTENWAKRFVNKIAALKDAGYVVYLTTDHGNILAHGWRNLTSGEKTFLYKDGSRGTRHLIYDNLDEKKSFVLNNPDADLLQYQNWLAFKGVQCFGKAGSDMITHGGAHFLEAVIPLVKI